MYNVNAFLMILLQKCIKYQEERDCEKCKCYFENTNISFNIDELIIILLQKCTVNNFNREMHWKGIVGSQELIVALMTE